MFLWTEQRTRHVKALAALGFSARQIAHEVGGGCSRSMVAKKCWRDKIILLNRPGGARKPMPKDYDRRMIPSAPPLSRCQFIVGELGEAETQFCGKRAKPGTSYCPSHADLCYRQPTSNERSIPKQVTRILSR